MIKIEGIGDRGAIAIATMLLIERRTPFAVTPHEGSSYSLMIPATQAAFDMVTEALERGGSVQWKPGGTKSGLIFPPGVQP